VTRQEGRTSFFEKKEAKKLLLLGALARPSPQPAISKSFLLLFFKKEALSSTVAIPGRSARDLR
jgi:hypothetical protein